VEKTPRWVHESGPGAKAKQAAASLRDHKDPWSEEKGADDLLDLVLNYELALQMARITGPFPERLLREARYRRSYFEDDGELRFRPVIRRDSIRGRLRRLAGMDGEPLDLAAGFLARLLDPDPALRMSAAEALEHPWLAPSTQSRPEGIVAAARA
jgi:serine/threonine protein kinase